MVTEDTIYQILRKFLKTTVQTLNFKISWHINISECRREENKKPYLKMRKLDQIQKIKTRMIQIKIPMVKQMNPAKFLNPKKL